MNLGFIEIERKTNVLALAAFLISLLTAGYQLSVYVTGPRARVIQPEGITIASYIAGADQIFISVIAPMAIANISPAREPLLMTRQWVELRVGAGAKAIRLTWHQHGSIEGENSEELVFEMVENVSPATIPGQDIFARLTLFTPQRMICGDGAATCANLRDFVSLKEFDKLIKTAIASAGDSQLEATFFVEFDNFRTERVTCTFPIEPRYLFDFEHVQYFTSLCD